MSSLSVGIKEVKNSIRNRMSEIMGQSIVNDVRACERIEKCTTVSFDIFDTLIFRKVKCPTDVFDLVNQTDPIFKERRIKAEQTIRRQGKEPSIKDIYDNLEGIYGEECCKEFLEQEFDIEKDVCYANEEMLSFFKELIEKGKEVVLVSDMYLPVFQLNNLLRQCGFEGERKIYVSNEYNATKRDGKLFEIVKNDIGHNDIIHIGDNIISDYIIPRTKGIQSLLYKRNYFEYDS